MQYDNKPLNEMYKRGDKVRFVGDHYSDPAMQSQGKEPDMADGSLCDVVYASPDMVVIAYTPRGWTPRSREELMEDFKEKKKTSGQQERINAVLSYLRESSQTYAFQYLRRKNVGIIEKVESGGLEEKVDNGK